MGRSLTETSWLWEQASEPGPFHATAMLPATLRLDEARPDQTTRHPCARSRLVSGKGERWCYSTVGQYEPAAAIRPPGLPGPPRPAEAPWESLLEVVL